MKYQQHKEKKMALKHANDETFESLVSSGLTLVDFWAAWCGPCQMFGPIFETVSEDEPDVNFVKFEIDESNRRTAAKFGIRSIPSVLAFKDGELKEARTGLMDEETLTQWVKELKAS
ncbi:MAG: thioredoxin [Alphaproteobacteria bacterium]|nr:thioredoxin [Alphaproteobacteria bacterium]